MTRPLADDGRDDPKGPRLVQVDPAAALRREGFRLAEWHVEPMRNRIVMGEIERRLDPRLIDVLVYMASRPGDVVTRDDLLDAVWEGVFVNENTLSQAISRLRKSLGDDRLQPRYIETISKSGYRLVADVSRNGYASPMLEAVEPLADDATESSPVVFRRWIPWAAYAVLAIAISAAWVTIGPSFRAPSSPPIVEPELTLVGNQFEPLLSPDGRTVAFAWQGPDQDGWDIWIKPVGADNPTRLTDHPWNERLPAWSADGTAVAYARFSDEGCGIFRSAVLGGPPERLAECMTEMRDINWSPDGSRLVVSGAESEGEPLGVFLLELQDGSRDRLTTPPEGTLSDRRPVFSPDGESIVFERRSRATRHDVMVVPSAGGEPRALTSDDWGQLRGVDWTADGESLVFSSNRIGRFALWKIAAAGGTPVRLPIEDAWVTQPSLSRSGGELIYRTFRDVVDIWSLSLDAQGAVSGEPRQRVPSTRSDCQPAWSPDGEGIAFVSDRSGVEELWSGSADGTDLLRHTDLAGPRPASPSWSPDGKRLVFDAAVHGHSDLWVVDRESRRPSRLTDNPADDRNGTFSRDGRSLYFASNRSGSWEIWRRSIDGSSDGSNDALRITEAGGFLAQESLDGRLLYYVKLDEPGIWHRPVAGGLSERVPVDLNISDWGNWIVGEGGIYFVTRGPTTISHIAVDTGEIREVYRPAKQIPYLSRSLSLSADRRTLGFAMIDHSDDEVMRVQMSGL